ncbi:MAG: exodeoxyribonuclease VII small subunit [Planctomycetota bacterium]
MAKKKSSSKSQTSEVHELSYEDAIEAVERITEEIERGDLGLDESIKAYERGVSLLAHCRDVLERAEQRVNELTIAKAEDDA